jgi:hypothetical protein
MRAPKGTPLGSRVLLYYYYSKEKSAHAHAITSGSEDNFIANRKDKSCYYINKFGQVMGKIYAIFIELYMKGEPIAWLERK